jgi:cytochrome P450
MLPDPMCTECTECSEYSEYSEYSECPGHSPTSPQARSSLAHREAHMSDIDLFDPATQEDWFPTYRRLRDEQPVYRMPGTNIHVVTRYDDVLYVLRHQELFPTGSGSTRTAAAREVYETKGWARITPLSTNPPDHRNYRELVDGFFDAKGSLHWQPIIEATIADLLDEMQADGSADYVEAFALPLPVRVITRVLGFPATDIPQLKAWSSAWVLPFSGPLTPDQEVWVAEQVVEFQHYIHHHIEAKRAEPGDDVLSSLVDARFGGDRPLSDHEIITIIDHLYIGGNETTTFALTSALWLLLREPGLYERVRADRSLVEPFIEEALRMESPTQGLYRTVAVDTAIGGVPVPAGATLHIRYGAANRDERMFPDPDTVHLDRANVRRHMAFSLGEHHCPGSGLSRLEQQLALNAVLDRLPDLRLAEGRNDFRHLPGFVLRALNELHIDWTPAPL